MYNKICKKQLSSTRTTNKQLLQTHFNARPWSQLAKTSGSPSKIHSKSTLQMNWRIESWPLAFASVRQCDDAESPSFENEFILWRWVQLEIRDMWFLSKALHSHKVILFRTKTSESRHRRKRKIGFRCGREIARREFEDRLWNLLCTVNAEHI